MFAFNNINVINYFQSTKSTGSTDLSPDLAHLIQVIYQLNHMNISKTIIVLPHDKINKMTVCPVKTQISLGICSVWSESSLCAQWVAKDPRFLHADSKDSDQTGQMPRLIWVFAGCTVILLVLSWGGSYNIEPAWSISGRQVRYRW